MSCAGVHVYKGAERFAVWRCRRRGNTLQIFFEWRMLPARNQTASFGQRQIKMKHHFFSILIAAVLLAACASLPPYDAAFSDIDQDHDGIIEWREFQAYYPNADPKTFLEADRNKDGDITPDEWRAYIEVQEP